LTEETRQAFDYTEGECPQTGILAWSAAAMVGYTVFGNANIMSSRLAEIPILLVDSPLLPHELLPLRLSEPASIEMLEYCQRNGVPFGVCFLREGGDDEPIPYLIGCTVRIVQQSAGDDGALNVVLAGEDRFRIRSLNRTARRYLVARVEPLVDEPWEYCPQTDWLLTQVRDAFRMFLDIRFGCPELRIEIAFPDDPCTLSFAVASYLTLDPMQKQRMLENTNIEERLTEVLRLIEAEALASVQTARTAVEEFASLISLN